MRMLAITAMLLVFGTVFFILYSLLSSSSGSRDQFRDILGLPPHLL